MAFPTAVKPVAKQVRFDIADYDGFGFIGLKELPILRVGRGLARLPMK